MKCIEYIEENEEFIHNYIRESLFLDDSYSSKLEDILINQAISENIQLLDINEFDWDKEFTKFCDCIKNWG